MMLLHTTAELLTQQAPIPDPGGPIAPPGSDGILTMLRWVLWIVFAVCFAGTAYIAGKMAVEHNSMHGGGQAVAGLWKPLGGAIIASSITGILAGVVTVS